MGNSPVQSEFLEGAADFRAATDWVRIWGWPRIQLVKSGFPVSFILTPARPSLIHLDLPVLNELGSGENWGQGRERYGERQIERLVRSGILWKEVRLPGRVPGMGGNMSRASLRGLGPETRPHWPNNTTDLVSLKLIR